MTSYSFLTRRTPGDQSPGYLTTPGKPGLKRAIVWLFIVILLAACSNDPEATTTPLPLSTPIILPTDTAAEATEPVAAASATLPPPPAASPTSASQPVATAEPTSTSEPAATSTPAETPTTTPLPTGANTIAPGGGVADTIAAGEVRAYRYSALAAFEPALLLVEPQGEEDVLLRAYDQEVTAANIGQLTPVAEWDFGKAGDREIAVFTPQEEGEYYLVVTEAAGGAASYQLYLFDEGITTPPVILNETGTLAAGASNTYPVASETSRAILLFVIPADVATDLAVSIETPGGTVANEGDFSGAGSAEALFILPRADTEYTVRVSEAAGAAGDYTILIIRLD
jgi:hypothetical protein